MKFSASPKSGSGKGYYKNFSPMEADMSEMGTYMRSFSLSSYLYTDEVTKTAGGEACVYRRAGECVVGAGNVMFFDFDSKYVKTDTQELYELLQGVSSYLAPSKGWSEALCKHHVAIELDRDLPLDKTEFARWYKAVAQWLKFEGLYDPAMESWVQQVAPHGRSDVPEWYIEGAVLDMDAVLAAYVAVEEESAGTFAGDIDCDFTLSRTGEVISADAMVTKVLSEGKQRVWCAAGLEHDGRRDTAFCDVHEGEVYYHCSGGRCGHTHRVRQNPFGVEQAEAEETVRETLRTIIDHSEIFNYALDPKAPVTFKRSAINYALDVRSQTMRVAKVEGSVRRFNGSHWQEAFDSKESVRRYIRRELTTARFNALAFDQASAESFYKHYTNHLEVKHLRDNGNYLNLRNGVLDIARGVLMPHSADMLFTSVLPYDYDPEASAPLWSVIVHRVMCEDKDTVKAFQQAMGYLLLRSFNIEKMIGFVGEGENGKSTVLKVLKKLVGRSGYSAEPIKILLKDSSEGGYSRARLAGKLVNITNELSPRSLEADAFKDLISGEDIVARNIFEAPFTLETVPKQVVAMNTTDSLVQERSHGFTRRLHLIPFDYRLKDEHKDSQLEAKLEAELSGILNWCLEGAREVLSTGRLYQSMAMKRLFDEVKRDSNPAQQFFEECVEVKQEELEYDSTVTTAEEMYVAYKDFCGVNGYFPLSKNKLINEIRRIGMPYIDTTLRKKGAPARRVRGFHSALHAAEGRFTADVVDLIRKK